jgi:hypothetical protein
MYYSYQCAEVGRPLAAIVQRKKNVVCSHSSKKNKCSLSWRKFHAKKKSENFRKLQVSLACHRHELVRCSARAGLREELPQRVAVQCTTGTPLCGALPCSVYRHRSRRDCVNGMRGKGFVRSLLMRAVTAVCVST